VGRDDSQLEDADGVVVPAGVGCFVSQPEEHLSSLLVTGHVRLTDFAQPLVAGYQLVAPPAPVDLSFRERGLAAEAGFEGAFDPEAALLVQTWKNDEGVGEGGYRSFFLFDGRGAGESTWVELEDVQLMDRSDETVFAFDRAFFLRTLREHPDHVVRMPTLP
jgi:hypothetical protein